MIRKPGISRTRRRPRVSVGSTTAEPRRNREAARAGRRRPRLSSRQPSAATGRRCAERCVGCRRSMMRRWPYADRALRKKRCWTVSRERVGELAASLVLDRSALVHNIKPLKREGLVEAVADEHDKRNRLVVLTEAGRAKLAQSMPLWEEAQRRFERAFSEEKARGLRATLDYTASPEFALRLDCK